MLELSQQDLVLLRQAVAAYLGEFGHEEADTVRRIKALLTKLQDEAKIVP